LAASPPAGERALRAIVFDPAKNLLYRILNIEMCLRGEQRGKKGGDDICEIYDLGAALLTGT
jgi:hypothetical protein